MLRQQLSKKIFEMVFSNFPKDHTDLDISSLQKSKRVLGDLSMMYNRSTKSPSVIQVCPHLSMIFRKILRDTQLHVRSTIIRGTIKSLSTRLLETLLLFSLLLDWL